MQVEIESPELTYYQQDIIDSKAQFRVVIASTKIGKTFLGMWWLFMMAHRPEAKAGDNYFWLAPVYSTAKNAFDRYKHEYGLAGSKAYKCNETQLTITCPNGAVIRFLSADNEQSLYGFDTQALVFDEFSRVSKKSAWNAIRSTLIYTQAPAILIGNYVPHGWVNEIIERAKSEDEPNYEYFKIDCYDGVKAGLLTMETIEQAKKDYSKAEFQELFLGIAADNTSQLIADESIQKLFTNYVEDGIKYLTIDVARAGADRTIALVWSGLRVIDSLVIEKGTLQEQVSKIQTLRTKYNINSTNTIADENGIGGFFVDALNCRGFINNARPTKRGGQHQNFASLKDECLYKMMQMVNENRVAADLPHELQENLIEELQQVKFDRILDTQKVKFMGKSEIKKLINRSPDILDSFMLRFYFELQPNYGQYHISVV
ncbi:terminase large subunit domain-containing protein [Flagellimonas onchidii]|uniref:terminase large subunit domain-containing protein n=1 Tax=Flagellimonas onchidii TaxID=2562684 RepID=UPI0010A6680D|nr:terminase family protein [Allomuricauda onchidii]